MARPEFEDLPFDKRPDLTPYLVHLPRNTKERDECSAFDNLVKILKAGEIRGSTNKGFITGKTPATCLMDVPFASLKYIFGEKNLGKNGPRYEPYGIFVSKKYAYKKDCRPVLYLSRKDVVSLGIPETEQWRVVTFEVGKTGWISWLHEREWRCKNDLKLPLNPFGVFVRSGSDALRLSKLIQKSPKKFAVKPRSIIPLDVICQGLLK
jgi:hypothetical protein